MISTEVLCATTSELGKSSRYSVCAVRTLIYGSRPETFLLQKKSHTKCLRQQGEGEGERGDSSVLPLSKFSLLAILSCYPSIRLSAPT